MSASGLGPSRKEIVAEDGKPQPADKGVGYLRGAAALAALGVVLAGAFAVFVPPLQVPDESAHFFRAYAVAHGTLIAKPDPVFPASVVAFVNEYPVFLRDWRRVAPAALFAQALRRTPRGVEASYPVRPDPTHPYAAWNVSAAAIYPPLMYVPATIGIWMAEGLRLSPLGMMYAARFANVLFFGAALLLVVSLAPSFRIVLSGVALLPMTLHQVGSVSGDSVTIAVSLLGFALILRSREGPVRSSYWYQLALVLALLALCKAGVWAIPLMLLIPGERFPSVRSRVAFIAGTAALMIASLGAWQLANVSNLEWIRNTRLTLGVDMSANSRYLLHHLVGFVISLAASVPHACRRYLAEFVGVFGIAREIFPPTWIRVLYLGMLLLVAVGESARVPFSLLDRAALVATFIAGAVLINVSMFISDASNISAVANPFAVQGRYFIPLSPAALLLFRQNRIRIAPRFLLWGIASVAVVCVVTALRTICVAYYA